MVYYPVAVTLAAIAAGDAMYGVDCGSLEDKQYSSENCAFQDIKNCAFNQLEREYLSLNKQKIYNRSKAVKKYYWTLARKYHPDKCKRGKEECEEKFKKIGLWNNCYLE